MNTTIKIIFEFIRHAETEDNGKEIFQGQGGNKGLSPEGRCRVEKAANLFKGQARSVLISSPLNRAMDTAEYYSRALRGLPITLDERFIEGNFGSAEGRSKEEVRAEDPERYARWRTSQDWGASLPEGETQGAILQRALEGVHHWIDWGYENANYLKKRLELLGQTPRGDQEIRLVVVSHAATIRTLLSGFGYDMKKVPHVTPLMLEHSSDTGLVFIPEKGIKMPLLADIPYQARGRKIALNTTPVLERLKSPQLLRIG